MTLLGTEQKYYELPGKTVSFLLNENQLDAIPYVYNSYNAKIMSTNTSDYKNESYTEVTINVNDDKNVINLQRMFEQENILWHVEERC